MTGTGRFWVVGTPGAGKSTLARQLAAALDVRHVELDDPFWTAGWQPAAPETFLGAVARMLDGSGWIADGQYGSAVAAHANRAHAVVWVDPPLWVILPRLVRRTLSRAWRREPMWSAGNTESWRHALGSESVIWYALCVHRAQRRANEELFRRLASLDVVLIRVRRPRPDALADALRAAARRKEPTDE
ncbi:adenylate kinase [Streptomyces sp. NPDC012751]|uniref:adenylate kinase n=1 Tax=Streptomyces sp. NPDC012751 TaxID=3364846 RepID=UPI0036B2CBDF